MKENIVLIGMPGAGKSTVGVVLAKRLGLFFLDSDLVIQEREGCILHEIIEKTAPISCRCCIASFPYTALPPVAIIVLFTSIDAFT